MSTELHAAYLEACRRFEQAKNRARQLAPIVADVAKALAGQARMEPHPMPMMDNVAPADASVIYFDPSKWPSAETITKVLNDFRLAGKEVWITWNQIPHSSRTGLAKPPQEATI